MGHDELQRIVHDRATFNYIQKVSQDYSNIIYDGLWFGPLRSYLEGFCMNLKK